MKRVLLLLCVGIFALSACAGASDSMDKANKSMDEATQDVKAAEEKADEKKAKAKAKAEESEKKLEDAANTGVSQIAVAKLDSRSGSDVKGAVTFTETATPQDDGTTKYQVLVAYEVHGMDPDKARGFHIHEVGDCSAEDASSAGGHFNPGDHEHGTREAEDSHAGDLGNITADSHGTSVGVIEGVTKFTLQDGEDTNIVGRSVIVHTDTDDLESQPVGDAGARAACGVIKVKE